MSASIYNIKKWYKMMTGNSVWHVNQKLGTEYRTEILRGYYNDLTQKVLMLPELLSSDRLPLLRIENGEDVYFPVAIFQYGLGAYDLFLKTRDAKYIQKFRQCVDWAIDHQMQSGAWNNFFYVYPDNPYGAMAQGEAISLLCRASQEFKDKCYLEAARKGIDFMLKSISDGGTTLYDGDSVVLLEYTHEPAVLNGWIFSWWGLYDYCLLTHDKYVSKIMQKSLITLIATLPQFNNHFWSKYDLAGRMASPFYHHLHIAQMQAMYALTGCNEFAYYSCLWQKHENNKVCSSVAFVLKAWQKLCEK